MCVCVHVCVPVCLCVSLCVFVWLNTNEHSYSIFLFNLSTMQTIFPVSRGEFEYKLSNILWGISVFISHYLIMLLVDNVASVDSISMSASAFVCSRLRFWRIVSLLIANIIKYIKYFRSKIETKYWCGTVLVLRSLIFTVHFIVYEV